MAVKSSLVSMKIKPDPTHTILSWWNQRWSNGLSNQSKVALLYIIFLTLVGCELPEIDDGETVLATTPAVASGVAPSAGPVEKCFDYDANGMALFGDLHVHTSYSFDAAANSTGATPFDAQRYALGEPIPFFPISKNGEPIGTAQLERPLDFLAVTDHGEFLGERRLCRDERSPQYASKFCISYRENERQGMLMLGTVITTETPMRITELCGEDGQLCRDFAKTPWHKIQEAANTANTPCEFTSFVGYEYTGTPGISNYHRNVIFRGEAVPANPVSYIDAPIDSMLWTELNAVCRTEDGCDYLTIPHNSNLANGRMAPYMKLEDNIEAKRKYARTRQRREPIMEIFQHKGGSECINGLSSVFGAPDELCDVEAVRRMGETKTYTTAEFKGGALTSFDAVAVTTECEAGTVGTFGMLGAGCVDPTDFQRSGLLVGMKEEEKIGLNPIKLGVIASTDTHSATPGAVQESKWKGAVTGESTPKERLQRGILTSGIDGNPGGLAGVWATENTRDAIFDAMMRREVFGTSGPRIKIRLFGGWAMDEDLCSSKDMISLAYETGVPMGGTLSENDGKKPSFLALALKDPDGQDLESLQLIKGWVDGEGKLHNDVVPLSQTASGASSLCTVYTDTEFDSSQSTYYYLRAVEPATRRWHTYDCEKLEESERPDVCSNENYPETIQEMAWSSPIWYEKP